MNYTLEKYHGPKTRHTCPSCGARREFVRYIDENSQYLDDSVGRCNREIGCNYHRKPKEFFADNPQFSNENQKKKANNSSNDFVKSYVLPKSLDFIPFEVFKQTLANYEKNAFVQFLFNLFPDCAGEIENVLKMYFVGTFEDFTCFPSVDVQNRICRAKLIRFDAATGKRQKGEFDTSSLPAKLKLKDFNYKQLFFGEHLLCRFPNKPAAIVEAEKSAIIGALCFPDFVWLGSNNKSWLNAERLKRIGNRQIILYPDGDGFTKWQEIAREACGLGLSVKVSSLIENRATSEQKAAGLDLADLLIEEQNEINEFNEFADKYSTAVDKVLSDPKAGYRFEEILNEQKAVLMLDGRLQETEAETLIRQPENLRRAAMLAAN